MKIEEWLEEVRQRERMAASRVRFSVCFMVDDATENNR